MKVGGISQDPKKDNLRILEMFKSIKKLQYSFCNIIFFNKFSNKLFKNDIENKLYFLFIKIA